MNSKQEWHAYRVARWHCRRWTGQPEYTRWSHRRDVAAKAIYDRLGWLPRDIWINATGRQPLATGERITEIP